MGKVKGIFASNITGKVGNVVFRKNGKQNVVAQRPASVKNPRSDLQQQQRAFIKTVASAYSVLKPICDHSYEGVSYGAGSMNFFNKENYNIVSSDRKAVIKNSSHVMVNSAFLVSKGSIMWNMALNEGGIIADIGQFLAAHSTVNMGNITIEQLLEALNIKSGDQLTVLNVLKTKRKYVSLEGVEQFACEAYYSRYILDGKSLTTKAFIKEATSDDYTLNTAILGSESEPNWFAVLKADATGKLKVVDRDNQAPYMHTAIISRKSADKWLRSTATLYTGDELGEEYEVGSVLPSYSPSGERYLNNAER